jgi:GxxExxY protein
MDKSRRNRPFEPLSEREEHVGKLIVNAAYVVHQAIGPGLLESVYEACFCHELSKANLAFDRQVQVPITYDGLRFEQGLRLDVLVDGLVICELKAVNDMAPVYTAQLVSYLKLTRLRLGYLINFNVPQIKYGIKRIVVPIQPEPKPQTN